MPRPGAEPLARDRPIHARRASQETRWRDARRDALLVEDQNRYSKDGRRDAKRKLCRVLESINWEIHRVSTPTGILRTEYTVRHSAGAGVH